MLVPTNEINNTPHDYGNKAEDKNRKIVDEDWCCVLVPSQLYWLGLAVVGTRNTTLVLLDPPKIVLIGEIRELVWIMVHLYVLANVMERHHRNEILPLVIIHQNMPLVTIYLSLISLMHMIIKVLMLLSIHSLMRLLSPTLRFYLPQKTNKLKYLL